MAISKLDSQLRVTLPEGHPGDEYDVQKQDEGRYLVVRVQIPPSARPMTIEERIRLIEENPIPMAMSWEELRAMTREP